MSYSNFTIFSEGYHNLLLNHQGFFFPEIGVRFYLKSHYGGASVTGFSGTRFREKSERAFEKKVNALLTKK